MWFTAGSKLDFENMNLNEKAHYTYVLWSKEDKKFYIGYTTNLKRRLEEHQRGDIHTTHRLSNPQFIFGEIFVSETDARRREQYFKTTKGKKTLRLMLRETIK